MKLIYLISRVFCQDFFKFSGPLCNTCIFLGTILSQDMILTASHCLSYYYHDMKVVVGQYYQDRKDPNEQIFDIENVTQHKDWE